jgi:SM-20-related protein
MGVRPIAHDAFERALDTSLLARFVDFLNTETFLELVRDITGARDIRRVGAQATCFTAGHFFSCHADAEESDQQRATCVFSLSPTWQRSWGGLLQFTGTGGKIEDVFVPSFNSLSLFKYCQKHAVSVVAPHAKMARYSVAAALFAT